ncbi:MAG: hypothetical protein RR553_09390, partial [Akkermansia sp.]
EAEALMISDDPSSLKSILKEYFLDEQSHLSRYILKWANSQRNELINGYKEKVVELVEQMKEEIRKLEEMLNADKSMISNVDQLCESIITNTQSLS